MKTPMQSRVRDYLAARRALGFALKVEGTVLMDFARYADSVGHKGPPSKGIMIQWASLPESADRLYWARRLEVVRTFAKHLAAIEPGVELPPRLLFGAAHRRKTHCLLTEDQIALLLKKATELSGNIRPTTYQTLLGLLAVSGLRISEALALQRADVDLEQGVLTIRNSKYRNSRLVPLHTTSLPPIRRYDQLRRKHFPQAHDFFVSDRGTAPKYRTVLHTFHHLRREALGEEARYRLHDLRHTFACRVLLRWQRSKAGTASRMPVLSRYLGHSRVTDTYWYLHASPELLRDTARHLEPLA